MARAIFISTTSSFFTTTRLSVKVLNPVLSTLRTYSPAGTSAKVATPSLLVTAVATTLDGSEARSSEQLPPESRCPCASVTVIRSAPFSHTEAHNTQNSGTVILLLCFFVAIIFHHL